MNRRRALAMLGATLVLPACERPSGSAATHTSSTAAASPPAGVQRIVIAGGPLGEITFAVGAGDDVVGTDTSCVYPAAVEKLPRVGYQRKLSAEGVLSLRPTLVLASHEAGPPEALAQIEGAGVRVVRFAEVRSPAAAVARIRDLGVAVGRAQAAADIAAEVEREVAAARADIARLPSRPRALFIYARGPGTAMVGGSGTGAAAMIDLAGGVNGAGGIDGFRPITAEAVVEARPEVIVIPERGLQSLGGAGGLLALPGIAATPAATSRRVAALDDQLLLGFGPRLAQALRALAEGMRGLPAGTR